MKQDEIKIGMRVLVLGGSYMAGCVGVVESISDPSALVKLDYNGGSYYIRVRYLAREE